jgi:RHS repeat-associated protein
VYDASGRLAAEYGVNLPAPTNPTISYLTEDSLGSVRVTTNSFGEIKARRDFLPFGEELYAGLAGRNANHKYSSNADDTRKKFATYQRDSETGLDFAQSRYYSPMQGRFTSPDEFKGGPEELFDFEQDASNNATFYADLETPQSLNKYQYGYNNPYKFNDPTGHCPECPSVVAPLAVPWILGGAKVLVDAVVTTAAGIGIGSGVGAIIGTSNWTPPGNLGDGSCPACDRNNRAAQQQFENRAASDRSKTNVTEEKQKNLDEADKKKIPRSQLGGSGKPRIFIKKLPTDKRAKDYARRRGQGPAVKDRNPGKGKTHWHSTKRDGSRKKGKDNIHVESKTKKGELPEK